MGMTEEQLGRLSEDILDQNLHSFGVRGTIKRAKLFYNRTDICRIESRAWQGTTVTLRFPILEEEE